MASILALRVSVRPRECGARAWMASRYIASREIANLRWPIASLVAIGHLDEARSHARALLQVNPGISPMRIREMVPVERGAAKGIARQVASGRFAGMMLSRNHQHRSRLQVRKAAAREALRCRARFRRDRADRVDVTRRQTTAPRLGRRAVISLTAEASSRFRSAFRSFQLADWLM